MNQRWLAVLLPIWVVVAIVTGALLIPIGDLVITGIGVVLIILGLISLMPALYYYLGEDEPIPAK